MYRVLISLNLIQSVCLYVISKKLRGYENFVANCADALMKLK